jgi:hypothetical protein
MFLQARNSHLSRIMAEAGAHGADSPAAISFKRAMKAY